MKKVLLLFLSGLIFFFTFGTVHAENLTQSQVLQLYVSIFGRASEGEGSAYWMANQSDMTAAANMDPQYEGLPAQDRFINKVSVCNYTFDTIATVPDVNDLNYLRVFCRCRRCG